ncbi:PKD domain-containing protein [Streptomyces sp. ISL-90]|nr:PKD domain-containing protein [Streptomyces sp. ISL-90]
MDTVEPDSTREPAGLDSGLLASPTRVEKEKGWLGKAAGTSSDEDGEIIEYLWDFGDGTTATGVSTVHEFTQPGTYLVTLAVRDEDGGESFTSSSEITVTDGYPFVGFLDPVENLPSLNVVKAGSSVPLKFELGGDQGLDILDGGGVSSRTVDCATGVPMNVVDEAAAPGASGLTYDAEAGVYTWVWKTSKPWASTCRLVELRLDDGSVHSAQFKLR